MGIPVSRSETKVPGIWREISIWGKTKTKFINQNIHLTKQQKSWVWDDSCTHQMEGLLNYSVVLELNEEMMQNKNVGYSCWTTPWNVEWQQHDFFIITKRSKQKPKIGTREIKDVLHLPKKWYLFTLTLTTIWSRPLNSSKMDRKCARHILLAEKPPSWPLTPRHKKTFTDLKTLIIDVKQDVFS